MAVRLNEEAVRAAVDPELLSTAEALLATDRLSPITALGGGASAFVRNDGQPSYEVWVGVVDRTLDGECDCSPIDPENLCAHAVALTLQALHTDFPWSSSATPPSTLPLDPEVARLTEIATALPPRRLARLLAEYAAADRHLAARLLAAAGQLDEPGEAELATLRDTIDRLADEATTGRWELADLVEAGRAIVDELELLTLQPSTDDSLRLVEHAARRWDPLAATLREAYQHTGEEADEISDAIRAVHVELCQEAQPDPEDLVERVTAVIAAADGWSCLDQPEDYLAVIGPDGVATLASRTR